MIAPSISYSQKFPTKTLKPVTFLKEKDNYFYTFNTDQTKFFYETKMLYDVCNKKTLYKDSIINAKDKVIEQLTTSNKDNKTELDSCNNLVDRQIALISKQDSLIKQQHNTIDKKNMKLSFLGGTTLAIIIAMIFL
jgi:hypothetical protein